MNDIEKNTEILNNLKKYLNLLINRGQHKIFYNDFEWDEKTIDCINAIEHILAERKQDKARIKELEVLEDDLKDKRVVYIDTPEFAENYIPKQKVKDLKESIILEPTIVGGRRNAKTLEYGIKLGKIKACEELLEDK